MHVAVTAVGLDRPGIVAAVGKVLFDAGANIEDSRMALLGGHFAMMLIVSSDAPPTRLEELLTQATNAMDLVVSVRPVAEASPERRESLPYTISVYGADHPGIVYRVTEALAGHGVNITDLSTQVVEGRPPVYVMILEVELPSDLDPAMLEADLEQLAAAEGIDVSLRAAEADTL